MPLKLGSTRTHSGAVRALVGLGHQSEIVAQLQLESALLFSHLRELLHVPRDFGVEHVLELFDVHWRDLTEWALSSGRPWNW